MHLAIPSESTINEQITKRASSPPIHGPSRQLQHHDLVVWLPGQSLSHLQQNEPKNKINQKRDPLGSNRIAADHDRVFDVLVHVYKILRSAEY